MSAVKAVAREALLVAAVGLVFAVAANSLSPRGLQLGRNYFPEPAGPPVIAPAGIHPDVPPANADAADPSLPAAAVARLRRQGLQFVNHGEAVRLFRDPRYAQGLVVFVDARDEEHYKSGHIPRAWPLNHYRPEDDLLKVLPACLAAVKTVVYCTGGDCDDSEFAALLLREAGVPGENLFVYVAGITEWTAQGLPVETGARGSGEIPPPKR